MISSVASTSETTTVSPSKTLSSRACFPKPIPRLDGHGRVRRNSVQGSGASASESEDDVRRNATIIPPVNPARSETAIQNDKQNSPSNNSLSFPKIAVKAKRKIVVSESARKLAEARREFQLKHDNKPPDRSQLRMYDFIHYNPTTNPMKKKPINVNSTKTSVRPLTETVRSVPVEEDVDDPASIAMPVPQVKVGPDGQLVIDEQSLVIENTGVKESREALANQAVIFEDNDFGNGFYKKREKNPEWPEWETIKFYKALNIVGTDFLLMQGLFPKRSRRQLKIKYKKEEKNNRSLVEKALKYSQEFDFDLLKTELESFENSKKIEPKSSIKEKPLKNLPKKSRHRNSVSSRHAAAGITENEMNEDIEDDETDEPVKKRVRVNVEASSKSKSIETLELEDCNDADSESDSEIYKVRPTRSGRRPKIKKIFTHASNKRKKKFPSDNSNNNNELSSTKTSIEVESTEETSINQETTTLENDENPVPDISSIEPGSLVIVSKESSDEPGKTVVQIYMVSSDAAEGKIDLTKTMTPIDINTENLMLLVNEATSDTTIDHSKR